MIDLYALITGYPDAISKPSVLRAYLSDLYPQEKKAIINILTDILACGIANEIAVNNGADELDMIRYADRLKEEFGYSLDLSEECLQIWADAYSTVYPEIELTDEWIHSVLVGLFVNEKIEFGSYWQENETEKTPIQWTILDIDDENDVLIISDSVLDCQPYDDTDGYVIWENCGLRAWLNDTFYQVAFNDREQESIYLYQNVQKCGNGLYYRSDDGVFLLSEDQLESCLDTVKSRLAQPTPYAQMKGCKPILVMRRGGCCCRIGSVTRMRGRPSLTKRVLLTIPDFMSMTDV